MWVSPSPIPPRSPSLLPIFFPPVPICQLFQTVPVRFGRPLPLPFGFFSSFSSSPSPFDPSIGSSGGSLLSSSSSSSLSVSPVAVPQFVVLGFFERWDVRRSVKRPQPMFSASSEQEESNINSVATWVILMPSATWDAVSRSSLRVSLKITLERIWTFNSGFLRIHTAQILEDFSGFLSIEVLDALFQKHLGLILGFGINTL